MSTIALSGSTGSSWLAPGRQVALFALFCTALALLRVAVATGMQLDDSIEHVMTQDLRLLYVPSNPPLYTWILWAVQQVVGVGTHSTSLLNTVLLVVTFAAVLVLARRVSGRPGTAALAAWSLLAVPQYALAFFTLTHTTLLMCACALSLVATASVVRHGRAVDYLALGLAIALGLMAKYNFALFLPAVAIAAALQPETRVRLLTPLAVIPLAVGALALMPLGAAILFQGLDLLEIMAARTSQVEAYGPITGRLRGLVSYVASIANYAWPLWVVAGIALIGRLRAAATAPPLATEDAVLSRLLRDIVLIGLALVTVAVLVLGMTKVLERYLHPILFPAIVYLAVLLARAADDRRRRAVLGTGIAIAAGVFVFVRVLELSPFCPQRCRDLIPYDRLVTELRTAGFERGTLLAGHTLTAGNLRSQLPDDRVVQMGITPPPRVSADHGQCALVWDLDEGDVDGARRALIAAAGLSEADDLPIRETEIAWHWGMFDWSWPPGGFVTRTSRWHYIVLDGADAEQCP